MKFSAQRARDIYKAANNSHEKIMDDVCREIEKAALLGKWETRYRADSETAGQKILAECAEYGYVCAQNGVEIVIQWK